MRGIGGGAAATGGGLVPKDARFRPSCLFGEYLLTRYPESMVVLVESPKNALFGVLAFPLWTWVATGNKGMLRREVLQPLPEARRDRYPRPRRHHGMEHDDRQDGRSGQLHRL